jgi:hypothetical protein
MLRAIRSLHTERGGWSKEVDLSISGSLDTQTPETYADLPPEQRSGLLVRYVSTFSGLPEIRIAQEWGVLLGLRLGRSRTAGVIIDRWCSVRREAENPLAIALDGEVLAGARAALAGVSAEAVDFIANASGGVSPHLAGIVALRSRRLRALGGRTLGQGVRASIEGDRESLGRLTPVSIVGPIRLQADALAGELRALTPNLQGWRLPAREIEQSVRDRMALKVANAGFTPRFAGTFLVDGRKCWTVGIEKPDGRRRQEMMDFYCSVLRAERPYLSGPESVMLIVCSGPIMGEVLVTSSAVVEAFTRGPLTLLEMLDQSTHYQPRWPLSEHLTQYVR